jgi:crotonobetainyl-CoA:carnitine CoA-transferase CaiB-like acyl-CoA transferase
VRFGGCDLPDLRHAPQLGEHSDELLRELGLLPT